MFYRKEIKGNVYWDVSTFEFGIGFVKFPKNNFVDWF